MKFAYSTNAYRRHSLSDGIARIAAIGYAGVEIMADAPHIWPMDTTDDEIESIKSTLVGTQMEISNINAFMMTRVKDFWRPSWIEPDVEFRKLRVEHTKASLSVAKRLGAPHITTEPGGPVPSGWTFDQALDVFVDGLNESLRFAEDVGVQLLVEPEPNLLVENGDQFLALAERVDSPMFGLNFDVGHFFCVGEDLPEAVERLARFTRHYHFEDIAATRIHEHLVPGHGAIDFDATLHAIRQTGYDEWLTVELYPYLDDPDAAGHEALEYLKKKIPA